MKIIIDAMGGDFAPEAPVRGALLAREKYGADIILTGRTADILRELEKAGCKEVPQGIEIANAEEVVEICDDPATAFKQKKDSSLTVGLNLLRDGQADGFISAGSTGALLAGATLVVKRIRGLRRVALAPTIPTMTGKAVLIDCGANAECTSEYLLQFAYLGSYYAQKVLGVENPRIGLLNIGAEESKSGFTPDGARQIAAEMANYPHVRLHGLMAIPPVSEKPGDNCRYFAEMRNLFVDISAKKYDNVSMDCLSMGMSGDYPDAIREGATLVRVGTAIFGARNYNKV